MERSREESIAYSEGGRDAVGKVMKAVQEMIDGLPKEFETRWIRDVARIELHRVKNKVDNIQWGYMSAVSRAQKLDSQTTLEVPEGESDG